MFAMHAERILPFAVDCRLDFQTPRRRPKIAPPLKIDLIDSKYTAMECCLLSLGGTCIYSFFSKLCLPPKSQYLFFQYLRCTLQAVEGAFNCCGVISILFICYLGPLSERAGSRLPQNIPSNEHIIENNHYSQSLRDQTVHWICAHFCVCMFLDFRDKSLNIFKNVFGFNFQKTRGIAFKYL